MNLRPQTGFLSNKLLQSLAVITNIAGFCIASSSSYAQITSDDTLGTQVKREGDSWEITEGSRAGKNLFHSFAEFSLGDGNTAFFNNAADVSNIISRVTGGSGSNINGLIKANGNANLILIDPSGINFGANASLDIGGSFYGSTARGIVFEDGTIFSAADTVGTPLLTMSVPAGLQMGQDSGAINITGNGHNLTVVDPVFSPIALGERPAFSVASGKTLALVGKGLAFDGAAIAAIGGKIELGSVAEGTVGIEEGKLDYENVTAWDDIIMRSRSLADASGTPTVTSGSIAVQSKDLSIVDGSLLLIQNQAATTSGKLEVETTGTVAVGGTDPTGMIRSSITNETIGSGKGGDIFVTTSRLNVDEGATIVAKTLSPGTGAGGNLKISASESVLINGSNRLNPSVTSSIVAASFGAGDSGNNSITTDNLTASAGGTAAATAFNTGDGGNLSIASKSIELIGIEPTVFAPSALSASTLGAGNAGNLNIDTSILTIIDGGRVDASTTSRGDAGNVTINAAEAIEVRGGVAESINPSLIISSANILDPALRQLLQVPDELPSGNSGNVAIAAPQLQILEGAQVTVRNDGTGDGGNLDIKADSVLLDTLGGISAVTQVGKGGNISLEASSVLEMQGSSQISSDNFGAADGGEININASKIQIGDRAFISSTTFGAGDGGDINITASESLDITGAGFAEFQQTFQLAAFLGTLQPTDRGTGIFTGTVSTGTGGNLNINTTSLKLIDGAIVFSPTFTAGMGGDISIIASDLEISGSALQGGAAITSVESAVAGDIHIATERLQIYDGGTIINATFGNGSGGNINIATSDSVEIRDSPLNSIIVTGIYTNTSIGSGAGGDINLETDNLSIKDGVIASNSGALLSDGTIVPFGGEGGNINIQASNTIEASGTFVNPIFTSGIGSSTYSDSPAGNLTIATEKLIIRGAADFASATLGAGDGGKLTITATDSIELIGGQTLEGINQGGLFAASGRANFPDVIATGASGDIAITTGELIVRDRATINVQSLTVGDGGNLEILADSILLDERGTISAATQSGEGGNINIQAGNVFWRGGSETTATAEGIGDGGNIQIQAKNLVALENSKLTANANRGRGGNIQIETQSLFVCPECQISASSRLGVDGEVSFNILETNTNLETVDLPQQLTNPEETVALACSRERTASSTLTITGRGGLPSRPSETLSDRSLVSFGANDSAIDARRNLEKSNVTSLLPPPAKGWYVNPQGKVILTANSLDVFPVNSRINPPDCHAP